MMSMSLMIALPLGLVLGVALGLVHFAGLARTSPLLLAGRPGVFLLWQVLRLSFTLGAVLLIARAINPYAALAAVAGFSGARLILTKPGRRICP